MINDPGESSGTKDSDKKATSGLSERIINRLKNNIDSFISGESLSKELRITRAAVWKRIKDLRARGYRIHASPSKGYRLLSVPDVLSAREIQDIIEARNHKRLPLIGREIHVFQEIDSTNLKGMDLGSKGSPEGTIILAETQSKGRGRLGRNWISPQGNIYLSVILRPRITPSRATLITLTAAVACASSLRNILHIPVSIKWPNDILIEGKKVGGILTEMNSGIDTINFIVLGIGINVNMDVSALPPDIRDSATSVKNIIGGSISRIEVLLSLLKELDKWYNIFIEKGHLPILNEWRNLSDNLGKKVKVASLDGTIEGIATDIDDYGRLLLRTDNGRIEKIVSGDVTIIR